jgi:hypothetical protein
MPNKLHTWVGTASAVEVGKMQYSCFFLRCLHSDRSCHRFLLFPRVTVSCPLPWEMPLHLMLLLYIINSLEVGGWLLCLHPSTQPTWPQLYACLVFCLLSFLHLPVPSVRFLGQIHPEQKSFSLNRNMRMRWHARVRIRIEGRVGVRVRVSTCVSVWLKLGIGQGQVLGLG